MVLTIVGSMPRVSEFYGIVIWMYQNDHYPAHFHAEYGEYMVRVRIDTLEVMDRPFPPRALRLVMEWAHLHHDELIANWIKAQDGGTVDRIEPLP